MAVLHLYARGVSSLSSPHVPYNRGDFSTNHWRRMPLFGSLVARHRAIRILVSRNLSLALFPPEPLL